MSMFLNFFFCFFLFFWNSIFSESKDISIWTSHKGDEALLDRKCRLWLGLIFLHVDAGGSSCRASRCKG
jgi:hypothetical protein